MNLLLHPPTCQCQLTHCIGCWQKLLPVAYASSAMCFPIADVGQIFEVTDADLFLCEFLLCYSRIRCASLTKVIEALPMASKKVI